MPLYMLAVRPQFFFFFFFFFFFWGGGGGGGGLGLQESLPYDFGPREK